MKKTIMILTLLLMQNHVFAAGSTLPIQPKINKDASKIEAIKGVWTVTYAINGTSKTETLAIEDTMTLSSGDIAGGGYLHSALAPSVYIPAICIYNPLTTLSTEYICGITSADGKSVAFFAFSYTGNTISSGYYGFGADSTLAALSLNSKNTTFKGSRPDNDVFDISSGLLTLPNVQVGTVKYSAQLKFINNAFTIQSANPK